MIERKVYLTILVKSSQIDDLKKELKSKVEIHDMSEIVSKSWNKTFITKRKKDSLVFNKIFQWERHLKKVLKKSPAETQPLYLTCQNRSLRKLTNNRLA